MVNLNCSTIPETPLESRSECHAWGAVVLYEFTAMDLGVKAYKDKNVIVKPYVFGREYAKGTVNTPWGNVFVEWKRVEDIFELRLETPKQINLTLVMPNSEVFYKVGGSYEMSCKMN